ncbi:ABC transporter ATP-binding protein [Paracoccus sp. SCSIO 75233]|uniref:ABC transporter ATP-binding protein n=1 Tax=Paracoccus sp. SCSIO 75233 TaxID=3017782 RepID=UPI0022F11699|nr:ABC transporter ATP-binding protein [Paracoccus sp. SCSIO 75233]WBU52401.1 ABC transporter ATP-binding protein [Paracoccus sp. SCSIO 75233]
MLNINNLTSGYSETPVLKEITIAVEQGQFVSIVGPNGAGKSTLFKTISGTVTAMSGSIEFLDQDLLALEPFERARAGIAHVPEGRQVFPSLSVLENLELGSYPKSGQRNWDQNRKRVFEWFPVLEQRQTQLAGTLSGGEQQMLAIGRGLASSPSLLMLDEPSMGLAPAVADFIFDKLMDIRRDTGLTILLVEQRVAEALEFADHGYVLETGRIVLQGDNSALRADDRIREAYLGM